MKHTELRNHITTWLSNLGTVPNLQPPGTTRGGSQIKTTFIVGPCEVMSQSEPRVVFFPIIIQWRFGASMTYSELPLGLIEGLLPHLPDTIPHSPNVTFRIGESEINVYRADDGGSWMVSLGFSLISQFYWESEGDYTSLLSGLTPELPLDIDRLNIEVIEKDAPLAS